MECDKLRIRPTELIVITDKAPISVRPIALIDVKHIKQMEYDIAQLRDSFASIARSRREYGLDQN